MTRAIVAVLLLLTLPIQARTEAPVAPLELAPVRETYGASMASDGEQSVIVWNDPRERVVHRVFAARVDAEGTVLDPEGVRLEAGGDPEIAYGDGRYFVIGSAMDFVIVDRDLHVVARGKVPVDGTTAKVVFNGRDFVVVSEFQEAISVNVIDRDGHVSEAATLVPQQYGVALHAVATNGSRIVVVYTIDFALRVAVMSTTGAPLFENPIGGLAYPTVPASISATSDGFFVAWGRDGNVMAARLDANGGLVELPVQVLESWSFPRLTGSSMVIGEGEKPSYRLVRRELTRDLVLGPAKVIFESGSMLLSASAATETLVAGPITSYDPPDPIEGLYVLRDSDTPRLVARAAIQQFEPRVASGEEGTLVAWREPFALRATFFPRAGEPETFVVDPQEPHAFAVATLEDRRLFVWQANGEIRWRIYRGGTVARIARAGFGSNPVAASDGDAFVVAWQEPGVITVVRVTPEGDIVAARSLAGTFRYEPTIACDDGECLVAWRNETTVPSCPHFGCVTVDARVMAQRLDASLVPIDATPLVMSEDQEEIVQLTAAADRGRYALAWVDRGKTYARALDGDPLVVTGTHPSIVADANGWLLVRETGRVNGRGLLTATRMRSDTAPYEFPLFDDAQLRFAPSLARDGNAAIAVYERTTRGEAADGVPRIFATTIEPARMRRRAISR